MTLHIRIIKLLLALLLCAALVPAASYAARAAGDQFNFAEALFIQMDYRSAVEEYQSYIKEYPQADNVDQARFRIGDCFFRLEDFKKAAAAYEEALRHEQKSSTALLAQYNLGRAYSRLDSPGKALKAFRAAAEADAPQVKKEAMIGAGETLIELKKYADALQAYKEYIVAFPKSEKHADALFSLAWIQMQLENDKAAVKTLQTLRKEHPEYGARKKVMLALSDCYTALGDIEEAGQVLLSLREDNEVGEEVSIRIAWNLYRSGQKKEAAAAFSRFADTYPQSPSWIAALFNAGMARFETDAYADAAPTFRKVMQEATDQERQVAARYWLGLTLFNAGKFKDAASTLKPLVEKPAQLKQNQRETSLSVFARALAKSGQPEPAVAQFRKFFKDYPDSAHWPGTAYTFAVTLEETGALDHAVRLLETLVEKYPESGIAPDARFALSEYLYRQKKPERALPYLKTLAAGKDVSAKTWYRLGWAYYDLEQYEPSLEAFSKLADRQSEFEREAQYMAGRAAENLARKEAALKYYAKAARGDKVSESREKALYRLALLASPARAQEYVREYSKNFPDGKHRYEIALRMADNAFDRNEIDDAMQGYSKLFQNEGLAPDVRRSASYGLAWCYLKKGALNKADQLFAELAADEKTVAAVRHDAVLQRAEIAYRKGAMNKAQQLFGEVIDAPGTAPRARYMLGWCARKEKNHDKGARHFRALCDTYPESEFAPDARLRLAESLNQLGEYDKAREILAKLTKPENGKPREETLQAYAEALAAVQAWQPLLEVCRQHQNQYPDSDRAYLSAFRKAKAYQGLGILDKAEKAYRETMGMTDTIEAAKAQFNIGTIYFSRKEYADAAKNFLRVEILYDYPELFPQALYRAVQAFRQAGQDDRAEIYVEKLRTNYKDSKWVNRLSENPNP